MIWAYIAYLCSRKAASPNRPCGLSRVQQCEREWRCVECECE
nr:MAG TPA: hypothetical protein [Caudoviricetes sp.]